MIRYVLHDSADQPGVAAPHFHPGTGLIWLDRLPARDSSSSSNCLQLTALHEAIHLYQTFGTLFGRFLSSGLNLRSGLVLQTARAAALIRGKVFLDLRAWRDDVDDRSDLCVLINRGIYACDRIERALGHLHGEPTIFTLAYDHTQGISPSGSHFSSVRPPAGERHPRVTCRGREFILTAASLMEAFACYWTSLAGKASTHSWEVDPSEVLLGLSDAWRSPETFACYALPLALCWDYLRHDGVRWFPVIVDLALNGPLPPWEEVSHREAAIVEFSTNRTFSVRNPFANYQWKWEDVHPGWRFVRILEFLRDQRPDLAAVPFLGTEFLRWYPPEMDLETFLEQTTQGLGWPEPVELFQQAVEEMGPQVDDDKDFFDNCSRFLFSQHVGLPGISAFPLHFLHLYKTIGLFPPPFVVAGDEPKGNKDAERFLRFTGLHYRFQMTDVLLRPLGNSWFSYCKKRLQCPLLEPPLRWLCSHREIDSGVRCANLAKKGCFMPGFFEHNLGVSMDDVVWFG